MEYHAEDSIVIEYIASGFLSQEHLNGKLCTREIFQLPKKSVNHVSKYFYDQFESPENTNLALNFGNLNNLRNSSVIRRAKFDLSSLQRYSNDNWNELISLQQYFRNAIIGSNVRVYIQSSGHDPFIVHLYSEEQINIYERLRIQV